MFDWYGATGPSDAPKVLQQAIDAAGVPIREIWAGDRLRVGDVTIDVIHPPHDGVIGSDNANSIVCIARHQQLFVVIHYPKLVIASGPPTFLGDVAAYRILPLRCFTAVTDPSDVHAHALSDVWPPNTI